MKYTTSRFFEKRVGLIKNFTAENMLNPLNNLDNLLKIK